LSFFQRQNGQYIESIIDQCVLAGQSSSVDILTINQAPNFIKLLPFFVWLNPDIFQKTFEQTTQYARLTTVTVLKQAFKSPNPALNVARRQESVACDIVYSDVPAINDGSIAAVLFVSIDTQAQMFMVLKLINIMLIHWRITSSSVVRLIN
jgi:hypothetical protein